ncbi:DNA-binding protein [Streptomyces inusitatus]|uniref:DNA-binding protein n=1 Tax=Streptomyces inusitatus TaxID=68221 RepID=A0A918QLG6_9ACTN|nr:helix-turn-helix transcriptional regulator [Streptomyces inusitatus]GGZ58883.1 DNA-binding protein [Streptomyces inusitatus]
MALHNPELRNFLLSRRARLVPGDVGLPTSGSRRVHGLRREEVAALADVSVDHYIRLERGRGSQVSDTVLDAVARALRLTPAEHRHLYRLARPDALAGTDDPAETPVRSGVRQALQALSAPAYLVGARGTVREWNGPACEVFLDFARIPPERRLIGWIVFTDPRARELYVDWESKAHETTAFLRTEVAQYPHDAELAAHVDELSAASEDFRALWSRHAVLGVAHGTTAIRHPGSGVLELSYETMRLTDDPREVVVVYSAAAGSPSAAALARLCARTGGADTGPGPAGEPRAAGE